MAETLKIALLQIPLVWEKPVENRAYIYQKIKTLSAATEMVILPEMFTTGFTMSPQNIANDEGQKTIDWMVSTAKEFELAIIGSVAFHENGAYTNRLFFITPSGEISVYDKKHTFTLAGEDKVYKAGKTFMTVHYNGFKLRPLVCYDLRFPVWSRNVDNYDALIYVANWPKVRVAAWDALLKARAIENMAYCVGVNRIGVDEKGHEYSGHSAVYDCLGEQLVFSEKEEVLLVELSKEHIDSTREKLKFLEDRDAFTLES